MAHEHFDVIGRPLLVGAMVAYEGQVWKVARLNPKTVTVAHLDQKSPTELKEMRPWDRREHKPKFAYAIDLTILPEQEVMLWLLKGQNK